MRCSAPVSALLTLSMAVNAFPILDLLRPRTPTKSYLVVNVEGSPSTGVPPIVTVTKEPSPVTVTERVTDTLTEVPSSVRATSSTTIQVVNVDQTPERSSRSSPIVGSRTRHFCDVVFRRPSTFCTSIVGFRDVSAVVGTTAATFRNAFGRLWAVITAACV
ncbi:hypothetical protein C8035_v001356 [Colletotrichum spinosum]|uniref:Uncharacterized protein n=1 Tax=Colletotrichum spinosum TaxID=1347390 RepID=A0A4R8PZS8_9PEZI|nr:hypothetical protein C8035_v001356 [Colletotrichum spinosum]